MDYKKLSGVKISDSSVEEKKAKLKAAIEKRMAIRDAAEKKRAEAIEKRTAIRDSAEKKAKLKAIRDAAERRRAAIRNRKRLTDSNKYSTFRITDSYKSLFKKIKDELSETETTEEAINVALEALQDAPAEQVLAAVTEVLGEAIDVLEAQAAPENPEEPAE